MSLFETCLNERQLRADQASKAMVSVKLCAWQLACAVSIHLNGVKFRYKDLTADSINLATPVAIFNLKLKSKYIPVVYETPL